MERHTQNQTHQCRYNCGPRLSLPEQSGTSFDRRRYNIWVRQTRLHSMCSPSHCKLRLFHQAEAVHAWWSLCCLLLCLHWQVVLGELRRVHPVETLLNGGLSATPAYNISVLPNIQAGSIKTFSIPSLLPEECNNNTRTTGKYIWSDEHTSPYCISKYSSTQLLLTKDHTEQCFLEMKNLGCKLIEYTIDHSHEYLIAGTTTLTCYGVKLITDKRWSSLNMMLMPDIWGEIYFIETGNVYTRIAHWAPRYILMVDKTRVFNFGIDVSTLHERSVSASRYKLFKANHPSDLVVGYCGKYIIPPGDYQSEKTARIINDYMENYFMPSEENAILGFRMTPDRFTNILMNLHKMNTNVTRRKIPDIVGTSFPVILEGREPDSFIQPLCYDCGFESTYWGTFENSNRTYVWKFSPAVKGKSVCYVGFESWNCVPISTVSDLDLVHHVDLIDDETQSIISLVEGIMSYLYEKFVQPVLTTVFGPTWQGKVVKAALISSFSIYLTNGNVPLSCIITAFISIYV